VSKKRIKGDRSGASIKRCALVQHLAPMGASDLAVRWIFIMCCWDQKGIGIADRGLGQRRAKEDGTGDV
jgi:hypothetical protein